MVFPMKRQAEQTEGALIGSDLTGSALTDDDLMAALCRREASALDLLYDRYSCLVYKIALRILHIPEPSADLTQEVFLELWNKPDRYHKGRASMAVFLSVMTRSRALNRIRQTKSQESLVQRFGQIAMLDPVENPSFDRAALDELTRRVSGALQQIPEAQRQVLEMAYYDGLSQSDITEKIGVPLGTVKSRSRQGLLKLRELLKDLAD